MEMNDRCRPRYSKAHKFAGIRFVFLDRDGVLNRKLPEGRVVVNCQDLELLFGALGRGGQIEHTPAQNDCSHESANRFRLWYQKEN
jgi:hypothetical protein